MLTLAEQVVAAELAYYRQLEQCVVTEADLTTWHAKQALYQTLQRPVEGYASVTFARHVLERHQHSLHAYMVHQLSVEAWLHWFLAGGLLAPFR
ncbi:MAG: hypothetical protein ACRYG7_13410 [Janthinobacterium lividum]